MGDTPQVFRFGHRSGKHAVIDSVGDKFGIRVESALFVHQRWGVHEDLVGRLKQTTLSRRDFHFAEGERVLVVDVINAEVVWHLPEGGTELRSPNVQNQLRTASGVTQIKCTLEPLS